MVCFEQNEERRVGVQVHDRTRPVTLPVEEFSGCFSLTVGTFWFCAWNTVDGEDIDVEAPRA